MAVSFLGGLGRMLAFLTNPIALANTSAIATGGVRTLSASGGSGSGYTYALQTNASGGAITAGTHWTVGDTGGGGSLPAIADVIRVTDGAGNYADFPITVLATLPTDVTWTLILDARTIAQSDNTDVTSWANTGIAGSSFTPPNTPPKYRTGIINGQPVVRIIYGTGGASTGLSNTINHLSDYINNLNGCGYAVAVNNATVNVSASLQSNAGLFIDHNPTGVYGGSVPSYFQFGAFNSVSSLYWGNGETSSAAQVNAVSASPPAAHGSPQLVMYDKNGSTFGVRIGSADTWHTVGAGSVSIDDIGGQDTRIGMNVSGVSNDVDIACMFITKSLLSTSQENRTINYIQSVWGASL